MQDVLGQLASAGLVVDPPLDTTGALVRVPVEGDRHRKRSGWYYVREYRTRSGESLYWGQCGNWKTGHTLEIEPPKREQKQVDPEARAEIDAQRRDDREKVAQERRELTQRAAERAARLWSGLPADGRSPYLQRKKVRSYGLRFARDGVIVVPVRAAGALVGLQFISPDGSKKFLTGTAKQGAMHLIGDVAPAGVLAIAEGYATGATVHLAMGWPVAVAFDAGNLMAVAQALRVLYPDAQLVLLADDDHATPGNPGLTKARAAAAAVGGVVAVPAFQGGPIEGCTDFNDLHVREGLDAVRASLEGALRAPPDVVQAPRSDPGGISQQDAFADKWEEHFRRNKAGEPRAAIFNTVLVLRNDPRWAGVLGYCDFSYRVVKRKRPPFRDGEIGEWTDADTTRLRVWLDGIWRFSTNTSDTDEAVLMAAQASRFHPVRDYLSVLMWDERPRVEGWLTRYLGVPDNDYTRAVGRYWLLAAVARAYRSPVKADCVLILEGLQGLGKSTAFKILGGAWYSDTHFQLGEKDGYQQMNGVWICELSELDSFNKAESTRAKQFFASEEDRYRPAYGRRAVTFPRQCVFGGTTNQDSYLKDPTGNRRYWPVLCKRLEAQALARDRDQLWAEAVMLYLAGHRWWPGEDEGHLFRDEQEKRFATDSWEDLLREYLVKSTTNDFTIAELAKFGLKVEPHQLKPPEEQRIGRVMARLGWPKIRARVLRDGMWLRLWVFRRPEGWTQAEEVE